SLKIIFKNINTEYFDEHYKVDKWHGKLVLNIIKSALQTYGDNIVSEIKKGYFGFLELLKINYDYFNRYIKWIDTINIYCLNEIKHLIDKKLCSKIFNTKQVLMVDINEIDTIFFINKGSVRVELGIEDFIV